MMPPWRYRRILVYSSWLLGAVMILAGIDASRTDFGVAAGLVTGGVSLISIVLSAYVGFATYEDVKLWPTDKAEEPTDESL